MFYSLTCKLTIIRIEPRFFCNKECVIKIALNNELSNKEMKFIHDNEAMQLHIMDSLNYGKDPVKDELVKGVLIEKIVRSMAELN